MLSQPTLEKLHELKFAAMAEAWELQKNDAEIRGLDFDDRFGLLVDVEWLYRKNRSLERKLREAKLRLSQATIEDIRLPGIAQAGQGADPPACHVPLGRGPS